MHFSLALFFRVDFFKKQFCLLFPVCYTAYKLQFGDPGRRVKAPGYFIDSFNCTFVVLYVSRLVIEERID